MLKNINEHKKRIVKIADLAIVKASAYSKIAGKENPMDNPKINKAPAVTCNKSYFRRAHYFTCFSLC